jgi:hypothetical protein
MGLAALTHPIPALIGTLVLFTKRSATLYFIEALLCGWWYIPFFLKRKKLAYIQENRPDKILGIYLTSYALMFHELAFLFLPPFVGGVVGLLGWILPLYIDRSFRIRIGVQGTLHNIKFVKRRPFLVRDVERYMPFLRSISEPCVILQKSKTQEQGISIANWVWAAAVYLLMQGVVLYNGLPATEVSSERLTIPPGIRTITIIEDDLLYGLDQTE